jgi:hypothetical protein
MNERDAHMPSFAELLGEAMNEVRINDAGLAKHIALDQTQYAGISSRTVTRWRLGEATKKGKVYLPKEREYILDMIKPLGFVQQGKDGLEKCNALLQAAGYLELNDEEQNKYGFKTPKTRNITLNITLPFSETIDDATFERRIKMIVENILALSENSTMTYSGMEEK